MSNGMSRLAALAIVLGSTLSVAAAGDGDKPRKENQMMIRIGSETFTATLADNPAATAFKAKLPLTVKMADLNANEKVVRLPTDLPTNDSNPKQIEAGDLMIWSSRSLVLFYKNFPTTYSYTGLGRINEASRLPAVVGAGDVTVTFELATTERDQTKPSKGTK